MSNLSKNDSTVNTIKTNQSLVHIKHSITIRQYKYWHLILKFFAEKIEHGIQPDKNGFYFESRSKFAEYIGYDQVTKDLKKDIEALRKEPIVINYLEKDGKPAIHGMGFISEYKITSNQIGYRLPSFIESVVRGDDESKKMFLLLNWTIFNSFTGKYEAIIYKLCKDYLGIGRTPYFSVDEYRDYIGLKESDYKETKSLVRRCITEPLKNLNSNEIGDILVEVEFKKQGRKTEGLYFLVKNKHQSVLPFEEFKPSSAFAFSKIAISPDDQCKYLEMYSSEEIEATIERANEYIDKLNKEGKPVKMAAIYNTAFKGNWGKQRLEERRLKQEEEEKRQKKLDWQKKKAEQKKQEAANKAKQQEQDIIDLVNQFNSLSNQEQIELIESMLDKNKQFKPVFDMLNTPYLKHGIEAYKHSTQFKSLLLNEIKERNNHQEEQKLIVDFENLSNDEKTKVIDFMFNLDSNNKKISDMLSSAYEKHGIDAHKQNEDVYKHLLEHLRMGKFIESLKDYKE